MKAEEIPSLVRNQTETGGVWADPREDTHPHDGLLRAVREAGAQRPLFVASIVALLVSPDVRHRTGAVAVLSAVAADVGAGRLAALIRDNEQLYRGVAPAWRIAYTDLEHSAGMAVASAVQPGDTVAIEWLRRMATERPWGFYVLTALARVDAEWLIARATTVVGHKNLGVIAALPRDQRTQLITALAPYPPEVPTDLTRAFWRQFPPDEAARLRALMWPEGQ